MRKPILVLLLLTLVITAKAQQNTKPADAPAAQIITQQATPEPAEGNEAFVKYMKRYANHWYNDTKAGSVTLTFTVEKDGSLTDFKIVHSLNTEADRISIDAAKEYGKKWKPAMVNGVAVSGSYTVVVVFV